MIMATLFLTGSPTRLGEDHFTADNGFLADVRAELCDAVARRRERERASAEERAGEGVSRVVLVSAALFYITVRIYNSDILITGFARREKKGGQGDDGSE